MKKEITTMIAIFMASLAFGQTTETELLKVLNNQFSAFNERDVDQLVDNVTNDFKWFYITSDTLLLEVSGKQNFRMSMESYYNHMKSPVTSTIEGHTTNGNRVSFKEVVEHKNSKGETISSSAMGIYEIKGGKISRAWYFID